MRGIERHIALNVFTAVLTLAVLIVSGPGFIRFVTQVCLAASVGLGIYHLLLWKRNA